MSEDEMIVKAKSLAAAGDTFALAILKVMEQRDKLVILAADFAERIGKQSELLAKAAEKERS